MNKADVTKFVKGIQNGISRHSPEILQGLGIAGMITTTVLAVKATPKAVRLIEQKKAELHKDKLTVGETIQAAWKPYIPAGVTGFTALSCLIGSSHVSARRNAALATAYQLSTTALNEYKEKVVETIGEKKGQAIQEAIVKDKIESTPAEPGTVIVTGKGNTLFFDTQSSRYFKHDIDKIRKIVNELNRRMVTGEQYISLNEFYYELGLRGTKQGDDLGWNVENGFIEPKFVPEKTEDEEPCLALDYLVAPRWDYANRY